MQTPQALPGRQGTLTGPRVPQRPEQPKRGQGAYGGNRLRGGTKEWSRIFGRNLSRPRRTQVLLGIPSDSMRILRYLLILVAVAGGILTFPNSLWNPFTIVFLGFMGLLWFAWGLGKPKEAPGTAQSPQAGPLEGQ